MEIPNTPSQMTRTTRCSLYGTILSLPKYMSWLQQTKSSPPGQTGPVTTRVRLLHFKKISGPAKTLTAIDGLATVLPHTLRRALFARTRLNYTAHDVVRVPWTRPIAWPSWQSVSLPLGFTFFLIKADTFGSPAGGAAPSVHSED